MALFQRLGVDVRSISATEFTAAYFALAKRYHPDHGDQQTHDLMANINRPDGHFEVPPSGLSLAVKPIESHS